MYDEVGLCAQDTYTSVGIVVDIVGTMVRDLV